MGWLQCDFWTFHGMSVPPTETAAFHPVQTSSQTVYQPWLLETSSRNEWSNRQIKNTHFPKRNWVLESRSQWFESMSDSGYIQEIPYFHYKVGGLRGMPSGELQDCPVSSPKGLVVGLSRVQGNANMQQVQAHSDVPWSHSPSSTNANTQAQEIQSLKFRWRTRSTRILAGGGFFWTWMCSIPVSPEGISRKSAFEWTRHSKTSHYFSPRRPPSRAFVVAQLATYFSDYPATKTRNEFCKAFKLHVEFARSMVLCVFSFEILIFLFRSWIYNTCTETNII